MADGPARFTQGFTCPALLRIPLLITTAYPYGAITLYGTPFQMFPVRIALNVVVLQPRYCRNNIGLGSSTFARRYWRNRFYFLFLQVLRWFTSLRSLRRPMNSDGDDVSLQTPGFPIRTSPSHRLFAPRRSFSQLITSFIAFYDLGIPRALLVA